MFFRILIAFLLSAGASLTAVGTAVAADQAVVTGVRSGVHTDKTRLVLDMTEGVTFQVFVLDNPYRVVIDLPEVTWQTRPDSKYNKGVIKGMRFGLFEAGTSRIVIDVSGPVKVHRAFVLPPKGSSRYRFVVDLVAVQAGDFRRLIATPQSRKSSAPGPKTPAVPAAGARKTNPKPVIVIDAGHGGVDPGTIGANGSHEKEVTLAVALELRRKLEKSGRYKVVMTRDRDVFVRLRNRVARGRAARGDLFLSLHADSIRKRSVRGASVYTLSEKSSDKEAAALAAKENKADIIAGMDFGDQSRDVANILIDLAQRETMNLSATFASQVIDELAKSVRVLRRSHRFAGFAVLKAPDVPSVLIEMGYLSNPEDERFLRSSRRRVALVNALARAINGYFSGKSRG
ncbi:MAG: N-acetylmuramoyl-L-alanine amidase [Rhodospirillaceae bacterium]|nr:N-acetylmuramoyl-L-alanine amidase [Rhodospirillaceae bacterium]